MFLIYCSEVQTQKYLNSITWSNNALVALWPPYSVSQYFRYHSWRHRSTEKDDYIFFDEPKGWLHYYLVHANSALSELSTNSPKKNIILWTQKNYRSCYTIQVTFERWSSSWIFHGPKKHHHSTLNYLPSPLVLVGRGQ